MKRLLFLLSVLITVFASLASIAAAQSEDEAVVHAVLFYSPTCPHCHTVINELLVPMLEKYGDNLQILGVNVTEEQGQALYQLTIEHYQIPPTRIGVPTLVVNDVVLVGSGEIPDQFPELVEAGLAGQGIDWPGIPGLAEAMIAQPAAGGDDQAKPVHEPEASTAQDDVASGAAAEDVIADPVIESEPPATPAEVESATADLERSAAYPDSSVIKINSEAVPATVSEATISPDPIAISLAGLILGGMLVALFYTGRSVSNNSHQLFDLSREAAPFVRGWVIPLLSLIGLIVAGYLAYVEITATEAICGPVGNCNAVQSSSYAQIAGLPVAVLGLANYLIILGMWLLFRFGSGQGVDLALFGILLLTLVGTIFSVYLTILEMFVIQAVCAWCLSSAIITTAIMLVVAAAIQQKTPEPQRPAPA